MLIDFILDRKDGFSYDPEELYDYLVGYDIPAYVEVARALDSGTEEDVKKALCAYIDDEEYNPSIKDYINSVKWLEGVDECVKEDFDDNFTEKGKKLIADAKKIGLWGFCDPYAGNFAFTYGDFKNNLQKITQWLKDHPEYGVVREDASVYVGNDYLENSEDGFAYFLTDWGFEDTPEENIVVKQRTRTYESVDEEPIKGNLDFSVEGKASLVSGYWLNSEDKELVKGWWTVKFFDDEGKELNHWLSGHQIQFFKNREDTAEYIKEVKSWNAIGFTQTLIVKVK